MRALNVILMVKLIGILVECVDGAHLAGEFEGTVGETSHCGSWMCPLESASCFKIVDKSVEGYTWQEAEGICGQAGGRLPIIHDRAALESRVLKACLDNPSWLALRQDVGEFRWQPTRAVPSYTNFKCERDQLQEGDCVLYSPADRPWAWSKANCSAKNKVQQVVCQRCEYDYNRLSIFLFLILVTGLQSIPWPGAVGLDKLNNQCKCLIRCLLDRLVAHVRVHWPAVYQNYYGYRRLFLTSRL